MKHYKKAYSFVIFLCLLATCAYGQNLDSLLSLYHKEGRNLYRGEGKFLDLKSNFNGAVLVAKDGEIIFKKAYGWQDREQKIPLQTDSKFLIGSISKPFTALLTLQLAEKGAIGLEQVVSDSLPWFPEEKGRQITIHHLLSNTSGLPHYPGLLSLGLTQETFFRQKYTPQEYAQLIAKVGFIAEPGAKYHYSSLGFQLLGAVLEQATGKSYAELLRENITEPLGLKNTGYADNDFVKSHVAKDYLFDDYFFGLLESFEAGEFRDQSTTYAAGGLHSTVEDLFVWSEAVRANRLLSPDMTQKMFTIVKEGYCYGWYRNPEEMLVRNPAARLFCHSGGTGGFSSYLALYDDKTTIIVLSNVSPINIPKLVDDVYRQVHFATPMPARVVLPSLRNLTHFNSAQEGGLEGVMKYHRTLSSNAGYAIFPDARYLATVLEMYFDDGRLDEAMAFLQPLIDPHPDDESIINQIGYLYLENKKYDDAIKFFQRNVQNHPKSANAYDSLGEAFEKQGNDQLALDNYRKAVSLAEQNALSGLGAFKENLKRMEKKIGNGR